MEDISIALLEKISKRYVNDIETNKSLQKLLSLITDTRHPPSMTDAFDISKKYGDILGKIFAEEITFDMLPNERFYWNIAEKVIKPMIRENHRLVSSACSQVQQMVDAADGLNFGSVEAELNEERLDGLIDSLTEEGITPEQLASRLKSYTTNITESFYDDFIKENLDFKYHAGMDPQVIRYSKTHCCAWCSKLAGTYDYKDIKETGNDVWRRHEHCDCQVLYKNNRLRYLEGAHTKRQAESIKGKLEDSTLDTGTYYGHESGSVRAPRRGSKYSAKNMPIDIPLTKDQQAKLDKYMMEHGYKRVSEMGPAEYYKVIKDIRYFKR